MANMRHEVLSMYKRLLRLGRTWTAKSSQPEDSAREREYICNETKTQFRMNQHLKNPDDVKSCLQQAESRLAIAVHYRIPYPRPVNVPPHTFAKPSATTRKGHLKDTVVQPKHLHV